jgi:hypothetical protein
MRDTCLALRLSGLFQVDPDIAMVITDSNPLLEDHLSVAEVSGCAPPETGADEMAEAWRLFDPLAEWACRTGKCDMIAQQLILNLTSLLLHKRCDGLGVFGSRQCSLNVYLTGIRATRTVRREMSAALIQERREAPDCLHGQEAQGLFARRAFCQACAHVYFLSQLV